MNAQEVLNFFLVATLLIITICVVFVTYYLVKALKSVTTLADAATETTQDLKNKLQMKALVTIPALIVALAGKILRRGR